MILIIIDRLFELYSFAIIVYVLMSWFPTAQGSKLAEILGKICEPYLSFFDRFVPLIGGISFAPIVALVALRLIQSGFDFVFSSIFGFLVILV
ncbi:YggT family protein [Liquorilactobacillus mali]|uniref:YggT family protein n=1 Tax=Liquorilactobacillus mali TaxID=1618 RepID=UPI00024934F0|nr:YggT family protein [Liquorilactobacillus mali]EJE98340.1 cell division protein [Liquorilactobacillus mali KCTC 3596 = DSM 20444]QFQ74948.1 YggT family protein [Liquorilactobacillus mali]